jgi:hypothetical protein
MCYLLAGETVNDKCRPTYAAQVSFRSRLEGHLLLVFELARLFQHPRGQDASVRLRSHGKHLRSKVVLKCPCATGEFPSSMNSQHPSDYAWLATSPSTRGYTCAGKSSCALATSDILTESDLLRVFSHTAAVFMHVTQVPGERSLRSAQSPCSTVIGIATLCREDANCVVRRHLVSTAYERFSSSSGCGDHR